MDTILIAYLSRTGQTEKMALAIAEGVRLAHKNAWVKKLLEITKPEALGNFAGLILGCPTYFRTIPDGMKRFLFMASNQNLAGKAGGAFGSYMMLGESGDIIYETMQSVFSMRMIDSGALKLTGSALETEEGIKTCQEYGKRVAGLLA